MTTESELGKDIFKTAFGEQKAVVTRDGIDVREYDHD